MLKILLTILVASVSGGTACTPKNDDKQSMDQASAPTQINGASSTGKTDSQEPRVVLPTNITASQFLINCKPQSLDAQANFSLGCKVDNKGRVGKIQSTEWKASTNGTVVNPRQQVTADSVLMTFDDFNIFPLRISAILTIQNQDTVLNTFNEYENVSSFYNDYDSPSSVEKFCYNYYERALIAHSTGDGYCLDKTFDAIEKCLTKQGQNPPQSFSYNGVFCNFRG